MKRLKLGQTVPKGPPPKPPPKNRLKSSSGDISSSNIGPLPPDGDRAKPLKGDEAAADSGPNLLSGSPPKRSYFAFLSASERI